MSDLLSRDCDKVVRLKTVLGHDPCNGLLSEVALNINIHFAKIFFKANVVNRCLGW